MVAELLLISGRGLKAKALGDPAVQGPVSVRYSSYIVSSDPLTNFTSIILLLSLCVVSGIRCKLGG